MAARQRAGASKAAFGRVGTVTVAVPPEVDAPPVDTPASRPHDVTASPGKAAVRERRRSSAPAAADAVAFTVRFDPNEAYEDDQLVLTLRHQMRRSRLDKAEVVRALLRAARQHADVRQALVDELRADGS